MDKKSNNTDQSLAESKNINNELNASEERRKAVKNILAGSGLAVGAATSADWAKPLVNSVILPVHAQMSSAVVLRGNVNISPTVTNVTPEPESNGVLDFFIESAYAGIMQAGPDLSGACMTMTIDGDSFMLEIEFASDPTVTISGTVSNNAISGSSSGITVSGTINLAGGMASGTVANGSGTFGFSIDDDQAACTPLDATTTTTAAPTTTTTTAAPTTTTTTTTTTAAPTTTTTTTVVPF